MLKRRKMKSKNRWAMPLSISPDTARLLSVPSPDSIDPENVRDVVDCICYLASRFYATTVKRELEHYVSLHLQEEKELWGYDAIPPYEAYDRILRGVVNAIVFQHKTPNPNSKYPVLLGMMESYAHGAIQAGAGIRLQSSEGAMDVLNRNWVDFSTFKAALITALSKQTVKFEIDKVMTRFFSAYRISRVACLEMFQDEVFRRWPSLRDMGVPPDNLVQFLVSWIDKTEETIGEHL